MTKRTTYHHGDLARALSDAALQLIGRHGVEGFTIREAAREVGVTHAAAYRHYEDKRALLATIAEEGFRMLHGELDAALRAASGDVPAQLAALGGAYVRFALREPARFGVMFGPRLNADGRFPSLEAEAEATFAVVLAVIERGQAEKQIVDGPPRDLASALWSLAHGFASLVLHGRVEPREGGVEAHFVAITAPFFDGLRARKR